MKYRFIILEGMSTSGKTTVMILLVDGLKAKGVACKGFDDQHILASVFTHLDPKESLKELHEFLQKECSQENRVIISDRFHLSHLAITKGSDEDLQEIEMTMKQYRPLLVFLEIPETQIKERILNAQSHRGQAWEDELQNRGETQDEAIAFFRRTQDRLWKLYQQSSLQKVSFDTEQRHFEVIAAEIVNMIIG